MKRSEKLITKRARSVKMSDADLQTIVAYAATGQHFEAAKEVYHRNLTAVGPDGNDHMRFMSEALNSCPDLGLRSHLRRIITSK